MEQHPTTSNTPVTTNAQTNDKLYAMKNNQLFLSKVFICVFSLLLLFNACSKDKGASPANGQAKKGYTTGKVTDTQGKPIAGAKILLDNTIVYAAYINATTGNDGTYSVKMPTGAYSVWKAYATITKEYNGKTYTLDLCPDNTNSFNEDGAVCNFTWKLSGKVPNDDYAHFGGTIDMDAGTGSVISSWDNVIITLAPVGNLIDGSQGKTITIKFGDEHWENYTNGITDIPIGRYKATAIYRYNGADYQLYLQNRQTNDGYKEEQIFDFEPENRWGHKNAATMGFHE